MTRPAPVAANCWRISGALAAALLLGQAHAAQCATGGSERPQAIRIENLSAADVLAIAARLIDLKQYDEAQALLDQLARDHAGGLERDFLDAIIALAREDYRRAESLFRGILANDPRLLRVRLELARTLFLEKHDEDADYQFRLAIAERPGEAVVRNIAAFREAIRARRAWRFNLVFGLAPDTNVNSATSRQRIDVLGLPFELKPDSRARSGVGMMAGGEASVRIRRFSRVPIYAGVYGRIVRYGDSRFNDIYVGGEAGPEFRAAGGRIRVAATGLQRWYGGEPLVTSLGGRLHYDKVVGGRLGIEASLSVRHNDYARRSDVDGWEVEAVVAANRPLSPSAVGFVWVGVERGIAGDPGQSDWQGRLGLGVLKEMRWGLRPQVSVEVARQVNDAQQVLFARTRRDWRLEARGSIYKRDWNIAGFAPSLSLTWTRNFSTIAIYDQKRLRGEIGVTRAF